MQYNSASARSVLPDSSSASAIVPLTVRAPGTASITLILVTFSPSLSVIPIWRE